MNVWTRTDAVILALLFVYVLAVTVWLYHRYRSLRRAQSPGTKRSQHSIQLRAHLRSLNGLALVAPCIGLAGTSIGLFSVFVSFGTAKATIIRVMASVGAASLVTTMGGIVVAIAATCSYNYLCCNIPATLECSPRHATKASHPSLFCLPLFGLLAATSLALLVMANLPVAANRVPRGFFLQLSPSDCVKEGPSRVIELRIANTGELFVNAEAGSWDQLPRLLQELYATRPDRTLYLLPDDDVPFQTVATAISAVQNATAAGNRPLNVELQLNRHSATRCVDRGNATAR